MWRAPLPPPRALRTSRRAARFGERPAVLALRSFPRASRRDAPAGRARQPAPLSADASTNPRASPGLARLSAPSSARFRDQTAGRAFGWKPAAELVGRRYKTKPCAHYADYRELCARKDLDIVIIGTPDHWHAVQTLEALRNGKDVYCEKPVTHFFAEGQAVYREVAKRKAIFQTGSQQRSDHRFRLAVEIVRNGLLGDIKEVQVGLPGGTHNDNGDTTARDYSKYKDYQLWTGPAPLRGKTLT